MLHRRNQFLWFQVLLLLLLVCSFPHQTTAATSSSESAETTPIASPFSSHRPIPKVLRKTLMTSSVLTGTSLGNWRQIVNDRQNEDSMTESDSSSLLGGSDPVPRGGGATAAAEEEVHNPDYDMTDKEEAGVAKMLEALTEEQKQSLADPHMPLRHFRAEKVRNQFAISIFLKISWKA